LADCNVCDACSSACSLVTWCGGISGRLLLGGLQCLALAGLHPPPLPELLLQLQQLLLQLLELLKLLLLHLLLMQLQQLLPQLLNLLLLQLLLLLLVLLQLLLLHL